ncbi:MAG: holo-ACP synthase [Lachnospiraceae bacterium]|nr:holo-ACP synthase [Lachnospiraceae bacterium]
MIFGIGVDTISISRVEKAISRQHFYETVFTEGERLEIEESKKRSASDFAGKEAVVKMFGTGFGKIRAGEIEILREQSGKPYVRLYGAAADFAAKHKIKKIHISITNTEKEASAFVVGETEGFV